MTSQVFGYAAESATHPLAPYRFVRRDPRPDDVELDILFCGVCHSDLHTVRNDWRNTRYPTVVGHEIVGRVTRVGGDVKRFKAGDVVAVGCMVDSCRVCEACRGGLEQHCAEFPTFTYNARDRHDGTATQGGYSSRIVVSEHFVLQMPKGLDLKGAAPLLCAGITTWMPLRRFNVGKGTKVAVVGLGGLGHVAIKLARAMGADVTLFTRSPGKEDDAKRLGAHRVVMSSDAKQMAALAGQFDLVLDTVPYAHDLNPYVMTVKPTGVLVLVGYLGPLEPTFNSGPLVFGGKTLAGSFIGGVAETQRMLDFCGQHGITADVETIAMKDINKAYERMLKSDVKYRFVIDMGTLQAT